MQCPLSSASIFFLNGKYLAIHSLCPPQVPRRVHHVSATLLRKSGLRGHNRGSQHLAAELSLCQIPDAKWQELKTQLHNVLCRHALALQQQAGIAAGKLYLAKA